MPERIEQWKSVLTKVRARVTTPDGRLRVEFGDDVDLVQLARVVAAEQQCCRFSDFALTIDRRGIALEVDAPDEAAEITSAVFGTAS